MQPAPRLIVGLGNPGVEYAWSPHNLGFLVIDRLAERAGMRVERPEAKSFIGRGRIAGQEVVLAKPQTYMNASGPAVRELVARWEADAARMIVISDEVALPWGIVRIREGGSAGGHNGLKSVIGALGSDEFIRVRLGVQPEHPAGDLAEYVTRPMRKAELAAAAEAIEQAADAVEVILTEGAGRAMSRFNRRVSGEEEPAQEI
jgi:PTH1 family peptidyl-tRNA hydrolase